MPDRVPSDLSLLEPDTPCPFSRDSGFPTLPCDYVCRFPYEVVRPPSVGPRFRDWPIERPSRNYYLVNRGGPPWSLPKSSSPVDPALKVSTLLTPELSDFCFCLSGSGLVHVLYNLVVHSSSLLSKVNVHTVSPPIFVGPQFTRWFDFVSIPQSEGGFRSSG